MLCRRERQVLDGYLAGLCRKQIAAQLGVSLHTVSKFTDRLFKRLGVSGVNEMYALFVVDPRTVDARLAIKGDRVLARERQRCESRPCRVFGMPGTVRRVYRGKGPRHRGKLRARVDCTAGTRAMFRVPLAEVVIPEGEPA